MSDFDKTSQMDDEPWKEETEKDDSARQTIQDKEPSSVTPKADEKTIRRLLPYG